MSSSKYPKLSAQRNISNHASSKKDTAYKEAIKTRVSSSEIETIPSKIHGCNHELVDCYGIFAVYPIPNVTYRIRPIKIIITHIISMTVPLRSRNCGIIRSLGNFPFFSWVSCCSVFFVFFGFCHCIVSSFSTFKFG